jgi:hypothetical protein
MKIARSFALICLLAAGFTLSGDTPAWKTFKSKKYRYSVQYPASWYLFTTELGPKPDSLDILNFPPEERVSGVILKDSGARIMVGPAPPETRTIAQWIEENAKFETQIRQREIKDFARNPLGCAELVEVTSLSEVGPEAYLGDTSYYCSAERGLYVVSLLNWKGDSSEEQLRAIALKIALSLKAW